MSLADDLLAQLEELLVRERPLGMVQQRAAKAEIEATGAGIMIHAGVVPALQMALAPSAQRQRVVEPASFERFAGVKVAAFTDEHCLVNAFAVFLDPQLGRPFVAQAAALRLLLKPLTIPRTRHLQRPDDDRGGVGVPTGFATLRQSSNIESWRLKGSKYLRPFPKCRVGGPTGD